MNELINFLKDGGWILVITVVFAILFVIVLRKGIRDAKEVDDDNELLTQDEIDIYKMSAEDKHLSDLIDKWGRKKFGDNSVNKREFTNRSDVDSVDMEFMNTIH